MTEEELEKQRKDFRNGELKLRIDEEEFNMRCWPALYHPECSTHASRLRAHGCIHLLVLEDRSQLMRS